MNTLENSPSLANQRHFGITRTKVFAAGIFLLFFFTLLCPFHLHSAQPQYEIKLATLAPENSSLMKIFREMKHGGIFINLDPVLPTSERSEQWQFRVWQVYMNDVLRRNGEEEGRFNDLPRGYKEAAENKPSGLFEQIQALRQVGFRDVDCFWKYGVFAMFGGSK